MTTRLKTIRPLVASLALFGGLAAMPAQAEGFPPYFGFSGYYGGPATYYTRDTDVHRTTRLDESGGEAFGVRTYTAGGPFWGYQPNPRRTLAPRYRKARYVRVKG